MKPAVRSTRKTGGNRTFDTTDYLDAAAQSPSWLTGVPWSSEYRALVEKWRHLPVYADREKVGQILHALEENPVTVIVSGTGSGKTVVIPKLALKYVLETRALREVDVTVNSLLEESAVAPPNHGSATNTGKTTATKVAVTNPKKYVSERNAQWAATTLDVATGAEVGYAFRGSPAGSNSASTRLLFATDGYLVAQHRRDPLFSEYAVIIVDEAHERTVYIDTLLFMLRRALQRRTDLRVVIMSATIDTSLFTQYFRAEGQQTKLLEVPGPKTHYPVETVFVVPDSETNAYPANDYFKLGMRVVGDVLQNTGPGEDVLFFVPTARDAERGCRELRAACERRILPRSCAATRCAPLYSKLSDEKREEATSQVAVLPFDRKIIFATNIAESSLTLKTLVAVIDSGLELESRWDAWRHGTVVRKVMSTRAQIEQRKGRVGRTRPGAVYHLYSRARLERQPMYPAPSILAVDVTDDLLTATSTAPSLGAAVRDFAKFITPPTPAQVASAVSVMLFHRLVEARTHFAYADFSMLAASSHNLDALADALDREFLAGRTSALGDALLHVMRRAKVGAWNALLLLAAMAFDDLPTVRLAALLEETNGDVSAIWTDEDAARSALARKIRKHPTSEHTTALRILEDIDVKREEYARHRIVTGATISKLTARYREMRRAVEAMKREKGLVATARNTPLYASLSRSTTLTRPLDRCVVFARLYHAAPIVRPETRAVRPAFPLLAETNARIQADLLSNPAAAFRNGAQQQQQDGGKGKRRRAQRTATATEMATPPKNSSDGRLICLYETLTDTPIGIRLNTVSLYPAHALETLMT